MSFLLRLICDGCGTEGPCALDMMRAENRVLIWRKAAEQGWVRSGDGSYQHVCPSCQKVRGSK